MNDKDPYESVACNCVEVGTLITENDTHLSLKICAEKSMTAEERFHYFEKQALAVGSGNCKIESETVTENGATVIHAMFDFDCTAEKLIFEMNNR